jgi:N-acetylmuramic acid 6-phosphate etherase
MSKRITEQESSHHNLERKSTRELLEGINQEDQTVPNAIAKAIPQIEKLVNGISDKLLAGGRLFYLGAGTSGRLGIVDASECPPTFGVPHELVIGLIAGGDSAIRKAVEFAEDDTNQGWKDLEQFEINTSDVVVGIAASGTTPYVIGALKACQENGIKTGSISCNPNSKVSLHADFPIEVVVGPEFVTGSTRMKSGTAQKLVLNMISTCVMIKLGRVEGNRMVDMQLSNDKLVDRGTTMVLESLPSLSYQQANELLLEHGSVRKAIEAYRYGR